jgi:hypothetical protein
MIFLGKTIWIKRFGPFVHFFAEGGGDGGGGGEGAPPAWHAEVPYLAQNPEASKAFAKYKTADDAWKGAHEAVKQVGVPFKVPADPAKLSDAQKTEFLGSVRKMKGVPETAEGYGNFDVPADNTVPIDEETMAAFKVLSHKQGKSKAEAQELLNLQLGMVQKLNAKREQALKDMTDQNYAQFVKEQNGEANALLRMGWVKELLQSKCTGPDGKPDPKMWESFAKRITFQDRVIELPLLRALVDAAQQARGTGGAPAGVGGQAGKKDEAYSEMKKK